MSCQLCGGHGAASCLCSIVANLCVMVVRGVRVMKEKGSEHGSHSYLQSWQHRTHTTACCWWLLTLGWTLHAQLQMQI